MANETVPEHWTEEYLNILEFYFWEPQHLNRVSPPADRRKPPAEVFSALLKREVPLNHQLNLFFRLAPSGLVHRWLQPLLPALPLAAPTLTNTQEFRRSPAWGACQPDLWFEDEDARCFVELKVDARSSLSQLCKYALLHEHLNRTHGEKASGLVFMGLSERHFTDVLVHVATREHAEFSLPERVLAHASNLKVSETAVLHSVRSMMVSYFDYPRFDAFLSEEEARIGSDEAAQTLRKLIIGMRSFLPANPSPSSGA
jgi:hypothetical protein